MRNAPFDTLVHAVYGCCAAPGQWRTVLDQLRTELGVRSAVLQRLRIQGERLHTVWSVQDSSTRYADYRTAISDQGNPRLESRRLPPSLSATGQLSSDDMLFSRDEQPVRAALQAQLATLGLGRYLGGVVELPDGEVLALALHRSHQDHQTFTPDVQQRVLALLPHLSQAVSLHSAHQQRLQLAQLWQAQAERWPGMWIICDRRGGLAWCNRLAQTGLQGLLSPCGQVRLARPADQRRLLQLLQQASAQPGYMAFRQGAQDHHLAVQSLPQAADSLLPDGELVMLSVSADHATTTVSPEALMSLFGLTGAEGRLLSGLVDGESLQDYAQRRGISVGTVRQQLKHVFAKTGATRQADLVRRVLRSVVAQGASGGPVHGARPVPPHPRLSS